MLKEKDLENDEVDFGTEKDETESMLEPGEQNFGLSDESSGESEDEGMDDDDDDDNDMDNKSGDYDDDDYDDDDERKKHPIKPHKVCYFCKNILYLF